MSKREVLYDRRTIRRTLRLLWADIQPTTTDQVISKVDVERAFKRLPQQYQTAISAWLSAEEDSGQHDWNQVLMELGEDEQWAKQTLAAAWDYLSVTLNPPRS